MSGHSWDDDERVFLYADIESEGELWSFSGSASESPSLYLNLKELAKRAKLTDEETKLLFKSKFYIDETPVDFAEFSTTGKDGGYDWDGPVGGWYHDVFTIVDDPTYENTGIINSVIETGDEDDPITQSLIEKLKQVDYEGSISDLEYDIEDTF